MLVHLRLGRSCAHCPRETHKKASSLNIVKGKKDCTFFDSAPSISVAVAESG